MPTEFDSSLLFRLVILDLTHVILMYSNTTNNLEELEELVLKRMHLIEIPPIISRMTRLKHSKIYTNFVGEVHFTMFQNLERLSSISLHEYRISVIDNRDSETPHTSGLAVQSLCLQLRFVLVSK